MNNRINDKKMEKSKVISARLSGTNLSLFNQLDISPTDLINYALKVYSEENISPERVELVSQIQSTIVNIHNYELRLSTEKTLLKKLQKKLELLDQQEFDYKSTTLKDLMRERYREEISKSNVDCVESFFDFCNDFILIESYKLKISDSELDDIKEDFYLEESSNINIDSDLDKEFDSIMGKVPY